MRVFVWLLALDLALHFVTHISVRVVLWSTPSVYTVCLASLILVVGHVTRPSTALYYTHYLVPKSHKSENRQDYHALMESDLMV